MTTLVEGEVLLLKLSNSLEAEPALIGRGIDLVIPPEHRVFSFDFDQSRPLAALRDALPELFNGLDKEKLNPQNPRAWLSVLRSFQRLRDQTVESVLQIYGLEDFLELSSSRALFFYHSSSAGRSIGLGYGDS